VKNQAYEISALLPEFEDERVRQHLEKTLASGSIFVSILE